MMPETRALRRTLGLSSVVLFGLAYMAPMIVFGTFGVLAQASQGTAAGAYLVALVAILLTAYSYGRMSAIYPISGSAYTYTRRAFDGNAGFLVGWAVLLDYFFLPMVIWLIGAAYLQSAFPTVPGWAWILAFIVVTSGINIAGIVVADRVNLLLMVVQLLIVAAFLALAARYVWLAQGPGGLLSIEPFFRTGVPFSSTLAGAALAAYSFLGFDAITTLTEETIDPRRVVPRAILLVALAGGVIFIAAAYVTQLVHPGGSFADVDSAAYEIAKAIGGDLFRALFLIGLIVAQFASGISAQASVGRLLFAMGRDGVLPRPLFGHIDPRLRTPVYNILLSGLVGLVGIFLDVTTSTSFINFGAFTAFTFVNVSVIAHELRHGGRHGWAGLVLPALGALADLWLLANLDRDALYLGLGWLTLGILYLLYLTRFFHRPPPEIAIEEPAE
jgi:amino acid transporter